MGIDARNDRNRHVRDYLGHYLSLAHAPHYAVLLNGAWGIGKTFLIKKFLDERFKDQTKDQYVYVSLYGLKKIEEIDGAIFQAMFPALGWKGTKIAGRIAKAVGQYFGADSEINLTDMLSKFKAGLYVFDDLERCNMRVDSVLGYINQFVEHEDCKVLIIANEEEIDRRKKYRKRREKLIGKSLEVQSAFDEPFDYFLSLIDDREARLFLKSKVEEIRVLYESSESKNLRILQQTMWDFERVYCVLTTSQKKNELALTILLSLVFALSFELKSGSIKPSDLKSRLDKIVDGMSSKDEGKTIRIYVANSRYRTVELHDDILSDELLDNILVKGIVDAGAVQKHLDGTSHFRMASKEANWRIVWHFRERPENDFTVALGEMEQEFFDRKLNSIGEILQVFGLRLWLAKNAVIKKKLKTVVAECKKYIDDLYATDRLHILDMYDIRGFGYAAYGGLGMFEAESAEFRDLYEHVVEKKAAADREHYPELGESLLQEMCSDIDLFRRRINFTDSIDSIYPRTPILTGIKPRDFVAAFMNLAVRNQLAVMNAIHARYEGGRLRTELAPELDWLKLVRERLIAVSMKQSRITQVRLRRDIAWAVDPWLGLNDEEEL